MLQESGPQAPKGISEQDAKLHDHELAARREKHEFRLERYKSRFIVVSALLGVVGALGAAGISKWAQNTSDVGAKTHPDETNNFITNFRLGFNVLQKLGDHTTPLSQILPVPVPSVPTPRPDPSPTPNPPSTTGGRCFGLDPANWEISKGPVTALAKGFNIKLSLKNKSTDTRGLSYYGDPAMTDDIGDRLTYLSTTLSGNERTPLTFAPNVELPIDLTFPAGSFGDASSSRAATYLSFTLPIREVVQDKPTFVSLACENLTVPPRAK